MRGRETHPVIKEGTFPSRTGSEGAGSMPQTAYQKRDSHPTQHMSGGGGHPTPGTKRVVDAVWLRGHRGGVKETQPASLLCLEPAEPSPILMSGVRARGQEIGTGSCGSGDSEASRQEAGCRAAAQGGLSFSLTP